MYVGFAEIFQAIFIGSEHNIHLMCCQCEPVVATMVRARLWPASPHRPHLAFTFELLDWAEALFLECQVSLMDFCKACFKCPHLVVKVYLHNDNIPATLLLCLHLLLEKVILFIHDRCIQRIQVHNSMLLMFVTISFSDV